MLRNQVAKQPDCSQKLLRRIPGTIYQLDNLDSLNAQLLGFHISDATIQTKYRSDASALKRCAVLGIEVIPDPELVGNAIHGESSNSYLRLGSLSASACRYSAVGMRNSLGTSLPSKCLT